MRTQLTRLSARLSLFLAACRAGRHPHGTGPGGACGDALGVLSWRNPRIMDDWLDRPNYCPPIAGYDGDVAVSVAARVDEAVPEAADDWMPCSASAGSVAVVVREPLARFLAGVATATTTGTAHAAAWSAWRAKRGHEAAKDEANIDDAATAYARDVAAGFRHTATQPVAARTVGKAWPQAVHVVVVRVEDPGARAGNVSRGGVSLRPRPVSWRFWGAFCGTFAADYACLGYAAPAECSSVVGPHGLPVAAMDTPAARQGAESLLAAYMRNHMASQRADAASRRYALATYFCPRKAGNGIFNFLNAFALAVVTNRTLVARIGNHTHGWSVDRRAACDAVLTLRDWVPREDAMGLSAANWTGIPGWRSPGEAQILKTPGLDTLPARYLDFWGMFGHNAAGVAMPEARRCLSAVAESRAAVLFRGGLDLAYGTLFHAAFRLAAPPPTLSGAFSVAVHSRHRGRVNAANYGRDISREASCLRRVIDAAPRPCIVHIMADREATRTNLSAFVQSELGCATLVAPVGADDYGIKAEHGPAYAFFRDLAVATAATDGIVTTVPSTASNLVAALVAHGHSRAYRGRPLVRCLVAHGGGARPWLLPWNFSMG